MATQKESHSVGRPRLRWLGAALFGATLLLASCGGAPGADPTADLDFDGLQNGWELDHPELGLDPLKANLIIVGVLCPGVTRDMVDADLRKAADFFGRMPNMNPDGTTGIQVTITWGNILPGSACTDYVTLRELGMPAAMRGFGHGLLFGPGAQGGQTAGPDWSIVGHNWWAMVHELGHQLGLDHAPLGALVPSPIYASLMNYDYSYQFDGDPDAVRFSTGTFSTVRLNELDLNERLPFARSDLHFLSEDPYHFELRDAGPSSTYVDFNRNGTFGESGIAADINGGSGLTARGRVDLERTAGGFVLVAHGEDLISVYPDRDVDWSTYTEESLSVSSPGRLRYQFLSGGAPLPPGDLATGVTGDPHAAEAFGKLFVVHPTARGYRVSAYSVDAPSRLSPLGRPIEADAATSQPVLVRTSSPSEELYLFIWDPATKAVRQRKVNATADSPAISLGPASDLAELATGLPVLSNSPIGATWNSRTERIALVTTESSGADTGRIKLTTLGRRGDRWQGERARRAMDGATTSRPAVLFDGRPSAGASGQYLIYTLEPRTSPDMAAMSLIRLAPGTTDIWTKQLMMNIWTTSRSAPSATLFGSDVAWGWRVNETFVEPFNNMLQVFLQSSGITDEGITDHNDVKWISLVGLSRSLRTAAR